MVDGQARANGSAVTVQPPSPTPAPPAIPALNGNHHATDAAMTALSALWPALSSDAKGRVVALAVGLAMGHAV